MVKKLYLSQLHRKYKIIYLHNPKHFFLNTLYIENQPNGQKLLCAYPRPHHKRFHRVALLKPRIKENVNLNGLQNVGEAVLLDIKKSKKPFAGIFQD